MDLFNMQAQFRESRTLVRRLGLHGGHLNRRRRASREDLAEWIGYYTKQINSGNYCPTRGAKIIAHFQRLMDRLED